MQIYFFLILFVMLIGIDKAVSGSFKNNKVSYDGVTTGESVAQIKAKVDLPKENEKIKLSEYPFSDLKGRFTNILPPKQKLTEQEKTLIMLESFNDEPKCDKIVDSLFISNIKTEPKLYGYSYLLCDKSKLLKPAGMIRNYIAKYGLYDYKDFDAEAIVYNDVKEKYKVTVRSVKSVDDFDGIMITIYDNSIFENQLYDIRGYIELLYDDLHSKM